MTDTSRPQNITVESFLELSPRERSLICIAVLMDGHEAGDFLSLDEEKGELFQRVCREFVSYPVEMRMPMLGSFLRSALEEFKRWS